MMAYGHMLTRMDLARALLDMHQYRGISIDDRNQRSSCFRWPLMRNRPLDERTVVARSLKSKDIKAFSIGKEGFQVSIDVQHFKPNELTVKIVNRSVMVEGKHEERDDEYGSISRHFVRRYALPKDYDVDRIASMLSSDGVLTVTVPKPSTDSKHNVKIIPIQQTGPAHLNIRDYKQDTQDPKTPNGEKANKVPMSPKRAMNGDKEIKTPNSSKKSSCSGL